MNVGVLDCPVSASAHRRVPAAFLVLGFVLVASVVAAVGFGRVPISAADHSRSVGIRVSCPPRPLMRSTPASSVGCAAATSMWLPPRLRTLFKSKTSS